MVQGLIDLGAKVSALDPVGMAQAARMPSSNVATTRIIA